jgi:hypothetical protein
LKPGQTLRLGQVEIRLDTGAGTSAPPASAPTAAPVTPAPKKLDQTMVMQRGVSLNELEHGPRTTGFDTASKAFSKKSNKTNKWFLIGGIIAIVVIFLFLIYAFIQIPR